MYPPVVCITDCTDSNAGARLATRINALFGHTPAIFPLTGFSLAGKAVELAAGTTLLDMLSATDLLGHEAFPTVVLANVAPRNGKWPNGVPFCYFRYNNHLVVSTFNPAVLSPLRQHLGIQQVQVTDISQVLHAASGSWAQFAESEIDSIVTTQFRSLWYMPLLARWVYDQFPVPSETVEIPTLEHERVLVGFVDSFGNCKLTKTADEVGFVVGDTLKVYCYDDRGMGHLQAVTCYSRLSHVPVGEPGLIIGSSGKGFVELVVGCSSAAEQFGLKVGMAALPE